MRYNRFRSRSAVLFRSNDPFNDVEKEIVRTDIWNAKSSCVSIECLIDSFPFFSRFRRKRDFFDLILNEDYRIN